MGCGCGEMTPTKSVVSGPPQWMQDEGKKLYETAKTGFDQGFQPYTAPRVAGLSDDEQMAADLLRLSAGTGNPNAGTSVGAVTQAGQAPGFNFNFSTITDENGPLGKISNYMDPYLAGVLDPTLREIGTKGAQQRQNISKSAVMSGAFGDARHGVVERGQREDELQAARDATAAGYSGAFSTAMGLRGADASRQFQTQQAQAGENNSTLARLRQMGIDLSALDKADLDRTRALSGDLAATGATERGVEQKGLDANLAEWMRQNNFTNDETAFLMSLLKGSPAATTQTTSQPDNSGMGLIGSVIGSVGGCI